MKYVIIGNSAAGIGAAEGIRSADPKGDITILSSEPHSTYSRPLISYKILGKVTDLHYRPPEFYAQNHCTLRHATVTAIEHEINAPTKAVVLADGTRVPYDKLLVATGSSPFVPPVEGLADVRDAFTFMTLDDANALDSVLDKSKRVLIVGAGLIGLKCAEGLLKRVGQITVVDLAARILPSILDETGAARVQQHLESKGIAFKLSSSVARFEQNTAILAESSEGERLDFDILVLAVGVRPNTALLDGIARIERGIVVNARSETSAPDIYAAGDCTQSVDASDGQSKIMALLPNAYRQGECAGINMAGGDAAFDNAIPMNAIGFFGLPIASAGNYTGDTYIENTDTHYKALFYSDNALNGYILTGNIARAGIYTAMIRERTPLDSLDFALVCEKPGLMAFTREARAAKLGGGA